MKNIRLGRDVWKSCLRQFDQLKEEFSIIFVLHFENAPSSLIFALKVEYKGRCLVKYQCWHILLALVRNQLSIPKNFLILGRNASQK